LPQLNTFDRLSGFRTVPKVRYDRIHGKVYELNLITIHVHEFMRIS